MIYSRKAALRCGACAAAVAWASGAWAQTVKFDVPSESPIKAVPDLARQAGIQVIAPPDQPAGIQTPAIKGDFEAQTALTRMLDASGIGIAPDDWQTIVLTRKYGGPPDASTAPANIRVAQAAQAQPAAQAQVAQAQAAQPAVEEVLVTGSLIRGVVAVGVPVTSLSTEDFATTGALTTSDVLRSEPSVFVLGNVGVTNNAGNAASTQQRVGIHVREGGTNRTLLMVEGLRVPIGQLDPTVIPALALTRIDVLADGASSTYGSDAISGVINIILKRGFSGAVTDFRVSESTDIGGLSVAVSQLYGRTWDTGDVTVTYEYSNNAAVHGPARPYFTSDFSPWGFDNVIPISISEPGIVSIGRPAAPPGTPAGFSATLGTTCSNCFSIPKGQDGKNLSWAQIAANPGVGNEINPNSQGDVLPARQRSAAVITFDQGIWRSDGFIQEVQFFVTAYYNNLRNSWRNPVQQNFKTSAMAAVQLPTSNPYRPVGAPSNLFINYDLMVELQGRIVTSVTDGRYEGGFNITLPHDWLGKFFYAKSEFTSSTSYLNQVNKNLANAALGLTITDSSGLYQPFTKPADVPYLNVFCDPTAFTCNSPKTLSYITAQRRALDTLTQAEAGFNFDGPVLDLPGGTLRAAIGGDYLSPHDYTSAYRGDNTYQGMATPSLVLTSNSYNVWAVFAQLNIPIIGPDNGIPLFNSLEAELSGRYDDYSSVGSTKNYKAAFTWGLGQGFSIRGTAGTSFRAPTFDQQTNAIQVEPENSAASGIVANTNPTCPVVGGAPVPGTAGAELNPTCSAAQLYPGGLVVKGSGAQTLRTEGFALSPESARNWSVGFEFAPTNFLVGLDLQASVYNVKTYGILKAPAIGGGLSDPLVLSNYVLDTNPKWAELLASVLANPYAQLGAINTTAIRYIQNTTIRNLGWEQVQGIDFSASYDWDMEDLGAWNAGVSGNYWLLHKTLNQAGFPMIDDYAHGRNSGGRMNYRARLGWTEAETGAWNATLFMNYAGHFGSNEPEQSDDVVSPPACFLQGNTPCNASGLPQFAQYTRQFATLLAYQPAFITFDLSVGYKLGDRPANDYLKNIAIQFSVTNLMNKSLPFQYSPNTSAVRAYNRNYDPLQRTLILRVTKTW